MKTDEWLMVHRRCRVNVRERVKYHVLHNAERRLRREMAAPLRDEIIDSTDDEFRAVQESVFLRVSMTLEFAFRYASHLQIEVAAEEFNRYVASQG